VIRLSRRAMVAGMALAPAVAALPAQAMPYAPHVGWTGDQPFWDPHGHSEPCRLASGPVPVPPTAEQIDWMI
jgi:hypothetical protein